ncbi:SH3 domain-containing protein [Streptomyces sp. 7N604]|uniref:SH3 domain-containing protein n=1 Tax=Streptomyces sp. 7N604 TaxID=3457415 RepID=UPI003FD28A31
MLQSTFSKLALCAATGVLATMTAVGPALAAPSDDDPSFGNSFNRGDDPDDREDNGRENARDDDREDNGRDDDREDNGREDNGREDNGRDDDREDNGREDGREDNGRDDGRRAPYRGRVIARTGLLLRDAPNRNARVVGSVGFGTTVRINCKVNSENVDGNPRWYLLASGHWAWASARYIENIGPAPHWC